jgi:two-component system, NtrC family, response regulator HydG
MARLHFHEGGRPLFVHVLRAGRTVIGRSDSTDIALPADSVSRIHCVLDQRGEAWWVTDRSRHGTLVNQEKVGRHELKDGDQIAIGGYIAAFATQTDGRNESTTMTARPVRAAIHEQLVEVGEQKYAACRAQLRFLAGPHTGRVVTITSARTTLGGPTARILLDDTLPDQAARLRVVRGRVLVEPGEVACFLAGERVREVTPALVGEEIRVGDHSFAVEVSTVEEEGKELAELGDMVGSTKSMQRLFGVLSRIAAHDATVLVTGESGTGKELAARAVHFSGPRHDCPFVAVNCAAITDSLFESELFGHEKGAFTGAVARYAGAFQQADGGTLFLDEVGELKPDGQAKLLRALESGEVRRVGATKSEYPDVRIVAATNRNLLEMVRNETFREDLYFRLAILTVRMPALRERRGDIGLLARTLLKRGHPGATLTPAAIEHLTQYDWPGNVREMRNVLTRAIVMGGDEVDRADIQFNPWEFGDPKPRKSVSRSAADAAERAQLSEALEAHNGNRTKAARALGMPRSSLLYKIKRHGL